MNATMKVSTSTGLRASTTKVVRRASSTTSTRRSTVLPVKAAFNLPSFDLGKKKAKTTKGSKKTTTVVDEGIAAQSFVIRIPGQFFQAKNDIVWPISLGFTKSNELFVGRMAMLGFAASLIGEILTGKGALAQFDVETGLPLSDSEAAKPSMAILPTKSSLALVKPRLMGQTTSFLDWKNCP